MQPIPILRHVPHEGAGTIENSLTRAGLEFRYVDLYEDVPAELPLNGAPGLIVMGGPMNVDETDAYGFLAREIEWLRTAIDAGLPVLGICLGSQLVAKALGAKVVPNGVKEIGWYPLELTGEAADDPLLAGCPRRSTVFQWHGDTFELPTCAVQLARSPLCENQAFRYRQGVYALQFHIEVTAEMIETWLDEPGNRR